MPEYGQLVHAELFLTGMHGTVPAGGENIDVVIDRRSHAFRVTIVTEEVIIVIDVP